jgi:hypothetical protein
MGFCQHEASQCRERKEDTVKKLRAMRKLIRGWLADGQTDGDLNLTITLSLDETKAALVAIGDGAEVGMSWSRCRKATAGQTKPTDVSACLTGAPSRARS